MKIVQIRIKPGFGLVFFCLVPGWARNKPNNCSVYWPVATPPSRKKGSAQLLTQVISEEIRVDTVRLPTNPKNVKSEVRRVRTIVRVIGVRK